MLSSEILLSVVLPVLLIKMSVIFLNKFGLKQYKVSINPFAGEVNIFKYTCWAKKKSTKVFKDGSRTDAKSKTEHSLLTTKSWKSLTIVKKEST